jgi:hypothetical protein
MNLEALVDDIVDRVRHNDPGGVDDALTFLEADPWCMRSGYGKERILHALGRAQLDGAQRRRAVTVVTAYVLGSDRREFRRVMPLSQLLERDVRPFLLETLRTGDPVPARHALWVLVGLPRPEELDEVALGRARELLLAACRSEDVYYSQLGWLQTAMRHLTSDEWRAKVTERALSSGDAALLRLLAVLPGIELTARQHDRLAELITDDVASGRLALPIEELEELAGTHLVRER